MTTIAELQVLVAMDVRQVQDGFHKIEQGAVSMKERHNSAVTSMQHTWRDFMIGVGTVSAAVYGIEKLSGEFDYLKASLDRISGQIGAVTIPAVRDLNKSLDDLAESDWPERIGEGFVIILRGAQLIFESVRVLLNTHRAAWAVISGDMAGFETHYKRLEQASKDWMDTWENIKTAGNRLIEGGEYYIPPDKPGEAPKPITPPKEAVRTQTLYDKYMESQITPESRAGVRQADAGPRQVNMSVVIHTYENPQKVVSDVAQGMAMGLDTTNVRPAQR